MTQFTVAARGTGRADYTSPVDVAYQSVGNLLTAFNAQTVGVFLQPEWAALQRNDLIVSGWATQNIGTYLTVSYIVPANQVVFINQMGFSIQAELAANRNNNQIGSLVLHHGGLGIELAILGGNGGGHTSFPRPFVFEAGETVVGYVINGANHSVDVWGAFSGYYMEV